jgi:hypothetical protein
MMRDADGALAASRPGAREGVTGRYVWLWVFGLALGWFEGAVVVYLRELYYPAGFQFPVTLMPQRIAVVELIRELASILLLVAAARLAGRVFLERFAAFLLLFGIWDLFYYLVLWLVLGWPADLATWDILFLIPYPWVGPVWAPCAVAAAFVIVGSYIYWTRERARRHSALDWLIVVAGGVIVLVSFLVHGDAVIEGRLPGSYPAGLFWSGWGLGAGWFLWTELRERRSARGGP